jgi:nucleotide-binding universal stress UspA family protein
MAWGVSCGVRVPLSASHSLAGARSVATSAHGLLLLLNDDSAVVRVGASSETELKCRRKLLPRDSEARLAMFGRIIVATDLQACTRMSLRAACDLLYSEGQVLLVHVIRPLAGLSDADKDDIYRRMKADVGAEMLGLASGFKRERGVEILCATPIGSPGQEIARLAVEWEADLVILAHDPVDDPAILGSVSFKVAHLAPCAVLVLKTPGLMKGEHHRSEASRRGQRAKARPPMLPGALAHVR